MAVFVSKTLRLQRETCGPGHRGSALDVRQQPDICGHLQFKLLVGKLFPALSIFNQQDKTIFFPIRIVSLHSIHTAWEEVIAAVYSDIPHMGNPQANGKVAPVKRQSCRGHVGRESAKFKLNAVVFQRTAGKNAGMTER